ncbi:hypothetical protein [Levilactobacillus fujinensis]|uniref:YxeA family protein n=1 Tax=Levilactobacillus fujinensis TaxID=2486024 RepID=A0ABW1TH60_9LACO|nr:hypothetical protein [Levilactobacillus fujinensis]
MSRRKIKGLIVVVIVLFLGVETAKIVRMPHHLTTDQILQRINTKNGSVGIANFSKSMMKVTDARSNHNYRYAIDESNQVLRIMNGSLKGQYDMKMATIDYKLVPEKSSQQRKTFRLLRDD